MILLLIWHDIRNFSSFWYSIGVQFNTDLIIAMSFYCSVLIAILKLFVAAVFSFVYPKPVQCQQQSNKCNKCELNVRNEIKKCNSSLCFVYVWPSHSTVRHQQCIWRTHYTLPIESNFKRTPKYTENRIDMYTTNWLSSHLIAAPYQLLFFYYFPFLFLSLFWNFRCVFVGIGLYDGVCVS